MTPPSVPAPTAAEPDADPQDGEEVVPFIRHAGGDHLDLRTYAFADPNDEVAGAGVDLAGQWIGPTGLGMYGAVAATGYGTDDGGGAAIGGAAVGGLYRSRSGASALTFELGAGFRGSPDLGGLFQAVYVQPTELSRSLGGIWGHLAITPSLRSGDVFVAATLAVDPKLAQEHGNQLDGVSAIVTGAGSIGYLAGDTTLSTGLAVIVPAGGNDASPIANLAAEIAQRWGSVSAYAALHAIASSEGNDSVRFMKGVELGVRISL